MSSIIAPFGEPIEARPPVPTEEERLAEREAKRKVKDERRRERRASVVDGIEVKSADEVLGGVQSVREEMGEVKDVQ